MNIPMKHHTAFNKLSRLIDSLKPLAFGLIICLASPGNVAQAQTGLLPSLTKPSATKAEQAPVNKLENPRQQAEAQLEEARRLQAIERNTSAANTGNEPLTSSDRQRTLDHLVLAYGERLKALDELDAFKQAPAKKQQIQALLDEFTAPPPYSALRVDLLRNEMDALTQRLDSLSSTEHALDSEKRGLIEAQRRAAEAVRLGDDKVARASNEQSSEKETQKRELASLQKQLVEAQLTNIGIGLERIALENKGLLETKQEVKTSLSRVIPRQLLSKDDLEKQQNRLREDQARLTAETDRRLSENARHMAEREKLIKTLGGTATTDEQRRQIRLLDEQLETDRIYLLTQGAIKNLIEISIENWAQRYAGLNTDDAVIRNSVIKVLSESKQNIENRQQLFHEFQVAAQTAVSDQEARLKEALLDLDASRQESLILELRNQRALAFQRIELGNARAVRIINRWLADLGASTTQDSNGQWTASMLQLRGIAKDIWNFEMFAVEDATIVDGKTVTTTYGVTVGKSIGSLFLFALTYWVASMLLRQLERLLVRRFGVNEQLASVIRRWSLIALAVVLIILILNLARIPLTAFAFMGGALAIGIGFGTQTIIKNVISGIIILFERKIRVGDIISLGGTTGHVTQVDLRASTVRGFDGIEALIPNSTLLENQVTTWTYSNQNIRREIRIGVAYGAPVHDAAEIILSCAKDHGQVRKDPPPEVFFEDFGDNALLMVLVFWVELGPNLVSRRVDSDLRYAMEKRLAAAGIGIPFPQRTIHLNLADTSLAIRPNPQ
jgi:small-conductance mechanosensitive channel